MRFSKHVILQCQGASFCFLIFFLDVIAPPPSIRWSQISGFSGIELTVDLIFYT